MDARLSGGGGIRGDWEDSGCTGDYRGTNFVRSSRGGREKGKRGATFSPARIATRVAELGRQISRACDGKRLDVVITLDRGFVFGADLIRHIDAPTVCHFVREDVRDVEQEGHARREGAFGRGPAGK